MTLDRYVELVAALLAIATAFGGGVLYLKRTSDRRQRQHRLEQHLREEKELGVDQGQRTIQHLVAHLGMTEKEVLEAALNSRALHRRTRQDDQGFANVLLLEYDDDRLDEQLIRRGN
jgi:hypothetical protein